MYSFQNKDDRRARQSQKNPAGRGRRSRQGGSEGEGTVVEQGETDGDPEGDRDVEECENIRRCFQKPYTSRPGEPIETRPPGERVTGQGDVT